jgi:hypothetical protein
MAHEICPALTELTEPVAPHVRRHLAGCLRCKALVRHIGIDYDPDAAIEDVGAPVEYRTPLEVSPGDVCAVVAPGLHHRLLCVATGIDAGVMEVVPISDEPQYASDRDLLLGAGVLGYETMAEAWNMGSLLIEDIAEVLAEVDHEAYEQLADLIEAVEDDGDASGSLPTGEPVVSEDDARHDFQQCEAQRARPFFASAAALRGASRLPGLLAHATEESGISVAHLSRRYGPMVKDRVNWVEDLIEDRVDVREVPARTVGALLAEFDFRPSERLATIVRCTGWADERHEGVSRMTLIGSDRDSEPGSDAEQYISELFEGLIDSLTSRVKTTA